MEKLLKVILILMLILIIFVFLSPNINLNKILSDDNNLSKQDLFNLYTFLESKYQNILLPKNIKFSFKNNEYICESLKLISNNNKVDIKIKFKPLNDNTIISKYIFFDKYGIFEIVGNNSFDNINNNIPNINHLSSDTSDDLNITKHKIDFDVNEIIDSDYENNELFLKNNDIIKNDIINNDTENDTTESIMKDII